MNFMHPIATARADDMVPVSSAMKIDKGVALATGYDGPLEYRAVTWMPRVIAERDGLPIIGEPLARAA